MGAVGRNISCGLSTWSSCFLIAISEDQVEAATLFMTYLGIHVRSLIVTVLPRFKGRKDRPHLSLEGYLLYTERWASGMGYLLWPFLESIISHTFQYLQSIPELKTLPWFLMTHMMKFNILRKTPQNLTPTSLWPHFLYSLPCSLSSCYPRLLAVLHYRSSFLLENQQACCSLLLVHSSPHYNVPSQGRDDSRIIFCFELLGPVSANSPVHMAPNMYAFSLFTSSTWP